MYLGTKTEKDPVVQPNRSRPTQMQGIDYTMVKLHPKIKTKLVATMQFHRPYLAITPAEKAPMNDPNGLIVLIS